MQPNFVSVFLFVDWEVWTKIFSRDKITNRYIKNIYIFNNYSNFVSLSTQCIVISRKRGYSNLPYFYNVLLSGASNWSNSCRQFFGKIQVWNKNVLKFNLSSRNCNKILITFVHFYYFRTEQFYISQWYTPYEMSLCVLLPLRQLLFGLCELL